ncbi:MAG: Mut7-C RNAse domain-containing protein [candidate division WOR-3 bacterium]|nr:MAG: Mut7-C RNAse domain-containing protein [candidate division WOR-3 bacterium]
MAKKFICNGMLGKLCNLLRVCGIDTLYSNQGMPIVLQARREARIILTKNTRLRGKKGIFFIEATQPLIQLKNVIIEFDLRQGIRPFSRCTICNEKLVTIAKESVRDKVPYFTFKNFNEFAMCPTCQRVYWKGSHYRRMLDEIKEILM